MAVTAAQLKNYVKEQAQECWIAKKHLKKQTVISQKQIEFLREKGLAAAANKAGSYRN